MISLKHTYINKCNFTKVFLLSNLKFKIDRYKAGIKIFSGSRLPPASLFFSEIPVRRCGKKPGKPNSELILSNYSFYIQGTRWQTVVDPT